MITYLPNKELLGGRDPTAPLAEDPEAIYIYIYIYIYREREI